MFENEHIDEIHEQFADHDDMFSKRHTLRMSKTFLGLWSKLDHQFELIDPKILIDHARTDVFRPNFSFRKLAAEQDHPVELELRIISWSHYWNDEISDKVFIRVYKAKDAVLLKMSL